MSLPSPPPDPDAAIPGDDKGRVEDAEQFATPSRVPVLVSAQILGGVGMAAAIAAGGLLAEAVSGSATNAGFMQTASVLGGALLAVPLARVANDRGRAPSLSMGYLVAAVGCLVVLAGAVVGWLPVLLAGSFAVGAGTTAGLQSRYAATDLVPSARRGRALSTVMWAATIGSVAGPNLLAPGRVLASPLGLPEHAGPFVFSMVCFAAAGVVVRALPHGSRPVGEGAERVTFKQAREVLSERPRANAALVSMACAHAMMVGLMVMTPVHLGHGGVALGAIGLVISLHVFGMYGLSPVMGWLADRLSGATTIMIGSLVLFTATVFTAGAHPEQVVRVSVGLGLLGLGWSAVVVAASSVFAKEIPLRERTAVQGWGDLVMGLAGAGAGLVAGPLMTLGGFQLLSLASWILLAPLMLVVIWGELMSMAMDRYLGGNRRRRR